MAPTFFGGVSQATRHACNSLIRIVVHAVSWELSSVRWSWGMCQCCLAVSEVVLQARLDGEGDGRAHLLSSLYVTNLTAEFGTIRMQLVPFPLNHSLNPPVLVMCMNPCTEPDICSRHQIK